MSPERLRNCFIEACVADVQALKPGNVRERSPARGVTAADFVRSAEACADALCARECSLGERIANAIEARRQVVKTNTNLGIVLLCAPLIQCVLGEEARASEADETGAVATDSAGEVTRRALRQAQRAATGAAKADGASGVSGAGATKTDDANGVEASEAGAAEAVVTDVAGEASEADRAGEANEATSRSSSLSKRAAILRARLKAVLAQTTVADARAVYRAIRRADAGNMGRVGEQDVSRTPTVNLRDAMVLAAERDAIAAEYAGDYERIFGTALPYYLALRARWGYNVRAVTGLYLFILGNYPDSLVARKFGTHKANALSRMFRSIAEQFTEGNSAGMQDYLAQCDAMLKARGVNPGTTADITVTSVFLAKLLDSASHLLKTGEDYDN